MSRNGSQASGRIWLGSNKTCLSVTKLCNVSMISVLLLKDSPEEDLAQILSAAAAHREVVDNALVEAIEDTEAVSSCQVHTCLPLSIGHAHGVVAI